MMSAGTNFRCGRLEGATEVATCFQDQNKITVMQRRPVTTPLVVHTSCA
jgi:hypothetical protein